jgi:hypothetical protein
MDIINATTRELVVLGPKGTELLDMDPVDVANNGDVASVWDTRVTDILDAMDDYTDEFGVDGLTLVWSDTHAPVLLECPSCECVKHATVFAQADDDDCLICRDCLND